MHDSEIATLTPAPYGVFRGPDDRSGRATSEANFLHSREIKCWTVGRVFDPARAIDLYGDVVLKATEWPTRDHSIKTLAKYLGFAWRDTHPSGAASIEWFDRWCKDHAPETKQRILDYNEDDCRATRVLLDGIRALG